jgi:hypothetical protein
MANEPPRASLPTPSGGPTRYVPNHRSRFWACGAFRLSAKEQPGPSSFASARMRYSSIALVQGRSFDDDWLDAAEL